ncbi:glycine-rich domain-containing protein [Nocardioides oleivorans]|uniref:glycine-rich domain-containing protein n=1 Tax=Nocardioides oleivorans TaxID=273676 RepID=UPI0013EA08C0|nr:hypothetical protein [Nocardioides oleivorans]
MHALRVQVWGGGGGTSSIWNGGQGGFVSADVYVTPGSTITFSVGGPGAQSFSNTSTDGGTTTLTTSDGLTFTAPGGHRGSFQNAPGAGGSAGTVTGSRGAGHVTNVVAQAGATVSSPDPGANAGSGLPGFGGSFDAGGGHGLVIITAL